MKKSTENLLKNIFYFMFWLVLAMPLVIYAYKFGMELSSDSEDWAEFGSAMSGIYAPILSVFTIILLFVQLRMQVQLNTHEYDQTHIGIARADIEFYLNELKEAIDEPLSNGNTFRGVLLQGYQSVSKVELLEPTLTEVSFYIERSNPRVFSLWAAIYPILMGLDAGGTLPYDLNFKSAIQKITAMLGFDTCVGLDNFHYSRSAGRVHNEYQFSPLFREK